MSVIFDIIILVAASFLIMSTADLLVRGAVELSLALKLPKVLVAATIVSFLTTAAELTVSFSSSLMGRTGMAVGSAVGSVICNVGLMFAVGAVIGGIKTEGTDLVAKSSLVIGSLFAVFLLGLTGTLGPREAAVLLILLLLYLYYNYILAVKHRRTATLGISPEKEKPVAGKGLLYLVVGGGLTILLARYGLVDPGVGIAKALGAPDIVIGLTLLAVGTSLPLLFTVIASIRSGHSEMAVANVLGSNVLNLLWVLGASAFVHPLAIDRATLFFNIPAALLFTLVMMFIGVSKRRFDRKSGSILLAFYVIYIYFLLTAVYRGM